MLLLVPRKSDGGGFKAFVRLLLAPVGEEEKGGSREGTHIRWRKDPPFVPRLLSCAKNLGSRSLTPNRRRRHYFFSLSSFFASVSHTTTTSLTLTTYCTYVCTHKKWHPKRERRVSKEGLVAQFLAPPFFCSEVLSVVYLCGWFVCGANNEDGRMKEKLRSCHWR